MMQMGPQALLTQATTDTEILRRPPDAFLDSIDDPSTRAKAAAFVALPAFAELFTFVEGSAFGELAPLFPTWAGTSLFDFLPPTPIDGSAASA